MHVQIIDRDEVAARVLAYAARRQGHTPSVVLGVDDLPARSPTRPAACVLSLPEDEVRPLDVVRMIQARYPQTCLLVTLGRSQEALTLPLLALGVQDVLCSPFDPREAIVRLELRARTQGPAAGERDVVTVGDLLVDLSGYVARKNGTVLRLTKLELRLLFALAIRKNSVTPTDRLLTFGWDTTEPPVSSLLKTHISHLRVKLARAGGAPVRIEPRHSLGYALVYDELEAEGRLEAPAS